MSRRQTWDLSGWMGEASRPKRDATPRRIAQVVCEKSDGRSEPHGLPFCAVDCSAMCACSATAQVCIRTCRKGAGHWLHVNDKLHDRRACNMDDRQRCLACRMRRPGSSRAERARGKPSQRRQRSPPPAIRGQQSWLNTDSGILPFAGRCRDVGPRSP